MMMTKFAIACALRVRQHLFERACLSHRPAPVSAERPSTGIRSLVRICGCGGPTNVRASERECAWPRAYSAHTRK